MLRTEEQSALADVLMECQEAAEQYRRNTDIIEETPLRELFNDLAARHEHLAEQLANHIRILGDLPQDPDADRETLESVATRIKSSLSGNRDATILDDQKRAERRVVEHTRQALQPSLPEATKVLLQRVKKVAEESLNKLDNFGK